MYHSRGGRVQGDVSDEEAELTEAANCEQGEGHYEEAAVARAHADAHPGAVMVVTQHTPPTHLHDTQTGS